MDSSVLDAFMDAVAGLLHTAVAGGFPAVILALIAVAYPFPAVLAGYRRHRNVMPIFVLNLVLGWTLVGWIIALVWAYKGETEPGRA